MEDTRNDSGTVSPEEVKKLEDAIKQKQIGAVRIYDGALSEEFCDELIDFFHSTDPETHMIAEEAYGGAHNRRDIAINLEDYSKKYMQTTFQT